MYINLRKQRSRMGTPIQSLKKAIKEEKKEE
jgi:hypothetical protein